MKKANWTKRWRRTGWAMVAFLGLAAIPGGAYAWGHGRHRHHEWSAEDAQEHIEFMSRRLARKADATDEQQAVIEATMRALLPDMMRLRERKNTLKKKMAEALGRDALDQVELETIRAEASAIADAFSRVVLNGVTSVAEALTAEQRIALIQHLRRFR